MRPLWLPLGLMLICGVAPDALADAPQIANITPYGLQRGVATDVTITGANLAPNPRLFTPVALKSETPAQPVSEAGKWVVRLTAPHDLPLGVYPIRVVTDGGISNTFLIAVGQLPTVAEVEPNNAASGAQAVSSLCAVEGQASGNDVDYFKFAGRKGQHLLIDAMCARLGSGIDPQIRLSTAAGAFIASSEDSPGLYTDARLVVTLPEDTEYVVEISDTRYQGGGRAVYRLTIGSVPVAEEVFPLGGRRDETLGLELRGGTIRQDQPGRVASLIRSDAADNVARPTIPGLGVSRPSDTLPVFEVELPTALEISDYPELREPGTAGAMPARGAVPCVFNGRISAPKEEDRFLVATTPGQVLRVRVHAADLGSALDGSLRVLNASNNQQIATGDDTNIPPTGLRHHPRKPPGTTSPDPSVDVTVPGGVNELAIVIRDLAGGGGLGYPYRIVVEPATPTVQVQLAGEPQVTIAKGGTVVIPISVVRQGYNGRFTLAVENAPPGLSVRAGEVSEGAVIGALSVTAAADAAFGPTVLDIVAKADAPTPVREKVAKFVVFAQQQNLPTYAVEQTGLAVATEPPRVLALETPADPIEAVHGFPATVAVKVARQGDPAKGELTIPVIQPLPAGLSMGETKIAADANEGTISVNVDPATAVGPVTLGFTAKGKFENKDQVFGLPAVTFNVVRPVGVEPTVPKLEVKAGQTIELKLNVLRRGAFKQPVTVQINGLPEGVKAEPVTVPPESAEAVIKIVADEKANAADAKCQLAVATFKLNDKDYATPNVPYDVKIVK